MHMKVMYIGYNGSTFTIVLISMHSIVPTIHIPDNAIPILYKGDNYIVYG